MWSGACREDVGHHVTTKSTKEIKDYYDQMYVSSVIGEGSIRVNHHENHLERQGGHCGYFCLLVLSLEY